MQMTKFKKIMSFMLCIVLIAAIALFAAGCNGKQTQQNNVTSGDAVQGETPATAKAENVVTELGEGEKSFDFTVVFEDGSQNAYIIRTDEKTVGAALIANGLISGDEGEFGLYVKTVGGETHEYETDGTYWAFYENGEYAATGVDLTDITEGSAYSFKVE